MILQLDLTLFVWLAAGKLPAGDVYLENSNKLEGGEDNIRRGSTIDTPHTFQNNFSAHGSEPTDRCEPL